MAMGCGEQKHGEPLPAVATVQPREPGFITLAAKNQQPPVCRARFGEAKQHPRAPNRNPDSGGVEQAPPRRSSCNEALVAWAAAISSVAVIVLAVVTIIHHEHPQMPAGTGGYLVARSPSAEGTPWQRMIRDMRDAHLPTSSEKALVSRFAPFRSRPERMSNAARRRALSAVGAPPSALAFDHAQLIKTKYGNLWLTAGHGLVCAFQTQTFALSCDAIASVLRRGLFLGVVERPAAYVSHRQRFLMIGVAPDGVRRIRFRAGAKPPQWVAVRNNTVAVEENEPIIIQALN